MGFFSASWSYDWQKADGSEPDFPAGSTIDYRVKALDILQVDYDNLQALQLVQNSNDPGLTQVEWLYCTVETTLTTVAYTFRGVMRPGAGYVYDVLTSLALCLFPPTLFLGVIGLAKEFKVVSLGSDVIPDVPAITHWIELLVKSLEVAAPMLIIGFLAWAFVTWRKT